METTDLAAELVTSKLLSIISNNLCLILSTVLFYQPSHAADFIVELVPAALSINDSHVSSISNTKISGLGTLATKSSVQNADIIAVDNSKVTGLSSVISSALTPNVQKSAIVRPTVSKFSYTDGQAKIYTLPAGVLYLRVKVLGGGGGGGGSSTNGRGLDHLARHLILAVHSWRPEQVRVDEIIRPHHLLQQVDRPHQRRDL